MRSEAVAMLTALVVAFVGSGRASAASGSSTAPSASLTTLQPVWPQYVQLDWSVETAGDARKVSGYLSNRQGMPVAGVQILAQALDASGAVIGQRMEWILGAVPGSGRKFFSVAGLPPATSYRLSVWDFRIRDCAGQ